MQVDFHGAGVPLCKTFSDTGSKTYPLVKNLTTYRESVKTLQDYADAIRRHAALGHWLYKGTTTKLLNNESRAGLTDTLSPTRILVLDIDGLSLDAPDGIELKSKFNADILRRVADTVVSHIPALNQISYVACASSSCGLVDNIRLHLHFFLDAPVDTGMLKNWLMRLNIDAFGDKLRLAANGTKPKWIIDPCLADNSRGIYIAPPKFINRENPFDNDEDRVVYVQKSREKAPLADIISRVDPEKLRQDTDEVVDALCKAAGRKRIKADTNKLTMLGHEYDVVYNPARVNITFSYASDRFAYYNINGGDSNAYYVYLDNPTVMFNFKGEDPFVFEAANPDAYRQHLERFKDRKPKEVDKGFDLKPLVYMEGNNFLTLLYSQREEAVVVEQSYDSMDKVKKWFANYGSAPSDNPPPAELRFDPTSTKVLELDPVSKYTYVNTFRPTEYMKKPFDAPVPDVGYETATMLQYACPTLYKIISHMLAYDEQVIKHFLNWLAFIFQRRVKPETCWVLQGTQGTGKGAFYRNVCRPLWGEKYAYEKQLQNFEDDKNGWERYALLVLIDEVNMKHSRSDKKLEALLKNLITDDERTVRAMRKDQVQVKSFTSVIMSTNDFDALNIPEGDRRYNVAPRQEQRLVERYPEFLHDREAVDELMRNELPLMAGFLQHFKVSVPHALTALENEAKHQARESGRSTAEAFFAALRRGDLDYFASVLTMNESDPIMLTLAMKCREYVARWLVQAEKTEPVFVENEQLRVMYQLLEGTREMTSNRFGRLMGKMGFIARRKDGKRGISVDWRIDYDVLKMHLESVPHIDDQKKFETAALVTGTGVKH